MVRQGELRRLHVIRKVLERVIKQVEAAEILSLSGRQIRRIVKRIRSEGSKGIIHRSRGRPSNRRISPKIKDRVIRLYRAQYKAFGPTLASEKLLERDRIEISDETLRRWLIGGRGLEEEPQEGETSSVEGAEASCWGDGTDGWVSSRLV